MGKMRYPKGRMVVVRDCTVAVCNHNNPASVLLSTLLFWHDNPHAGDALDEKEHTFTMRRTQIDIETQACNQIDVKTIHDTAVPILQLFGYLTVQEKMNGNLYILHIDRIEMAYAAYESGDQALKNFLKASLQLESAPIQIPEDELESVLINRRRLYSKLELVLIATRADSNCKRGRKPKSQATLNDKISSLENKRDSKRIYTEREEKSSPSPSSDISISQEAGIISPKEPIVPIPNTELSRTDQLRQWVSDFGVEVSQRDLAKVEQQYQGIASEIQTREDFQSLHTIALEKVKRIPNNDGKVKLGNLVSALKEWRIAQAPTNVAEPIEDDCCNAQYAPSERDTTALIAAIEQYNPALKVAVKQTDFGVSVSIKRDDQEHRNIPVFSLDDWYNNVLKKDLGLLGQAVKYGQSLKRSA